VTGHESFQNQPLVRDGMPRQQRSQPLDILGHREGEGLCVVCACVVCVCRVCVMCVSCVCYVCVMCVSCVCHVCVMCVSCVCHVCVMCVSCVYRDVRYNVDVHKYCLYTHTHFEQCACTTTHPRA